MTGLLLPLIVRAGSFDLYDHSISPLSLFRAMSSPEPVLTIINLASTAAGAKTSPFTFEVHNSVPLFWSKAITFPSISATISIPKPADIPVDNKLTSFFQLMLPDIELIDLIFPDESAKYIESPANDGMKLPNKFSPVNEISQLVIIFLLLEIFSNFLGSSSSYSSFSPCQN